MGTEKTFTIITGEGVKEAKEIKFEMEPIPFKAFGRTTRISNIELSKIIREQFQKMFHDCVGCLVNYTNGFNVTLYFENNALDIPEGKFKNLINVQTTQGIDKNNLFERMGALQKRTTGITYELNDATKHVLSKFMYGGPKAHPVENKNDWKKYITERKIPAGNMWQPTSERIIVSVTGLDLRVILHELYGGTMVVSTVKDGDVVVNKQSENVRYEVRYAKALPDGSFMINIEQFDKEEIENINKKENPQFVTNYGVLMY